jgi:hypothetical protein
MQSLRPANTLATAMRGAGAAAWTFYYYFTARAATD